MRRAGGGIGSVIGSGVSVACGGGCGRVGGELRCGGVRWCRAVVLSCFRCTLYCKKDFCLLTDTIDK